MSQIDRNTLFELSNYLATESSRLFKKAAGHATRWEAVRAEQAQNEALKLAKWASAVREALISSPAPVAEQPPTPKMVGIKEFLDSQQETCSMARPYGLALWGCEKEKAHKGECDFTKNIS